MMCYYRFLECQLKHFFGLGLLLSLCDALASLHRGSSHANLLRKTMLLSAFGLKQNNRQQLNPSASCKPGISNNRDTHASHANKNLCRYLNVNFVWGQSSADRDLKKFNVAVWFKAVSYLFSAGDTDRHLSQAKHMLGHELTRTRTHARSH